MVQRRRSAELNAPGKAEQRDVAGADGKDAGHDCQSPSRRRVESVCSDCRLVTEDDKDSPFYSYALSNAFASTSTVRLEDMSCEEQEFDEFPEGEMEEMTFNPNPDLPDDLSDVSDRRSRSGSSSCHDGEQDASSAESSPGTTQFTCLLCKEPPEQLSATICGHLFCFE
ncbi:hypothetical protein ONZ45_g15895 [Pleurotus djamor]|nr:hypothetical protein ONZ45_g15895 [Pleurotus djamor]